MLHLDSCQHTISYVGHTISYNSDVTCDIVCFDVRYRTHTISHVRTYDIDIRHRILRTYDIATYDIVRLTYDVVCNIRCRMSHIRCRMLQIVCDIVCYGQHIVRSRLHIVYVVVYDIVYDFLFDMILEFQKCIPDRERTSGLHSSVFIAVHITPFTSFTTKD